MTKLEPGYYWVRLKLGGELTIAELEDDDGHRMWWFLGNEMWAKDPGGKVIARLEPPA